MKKLFNRKTVILAGIVLLISLLAACGDSASESNASKKNEDLSIEVVAKGFQHDFWRAVNIGAEDAAEEYGVKINFVGPKDELAVAEQVEMINNAVNKKPSAIALAALDTNASMDLINQAMNEEIPIVGFDSGVPEAPEGAIVANASTDNYAAGELAAEHMYEAIKDKVSDDEISRIGVVAQEVNSMSITERTVGFIDKMEELLEGHDEIGEGNVAVAGHDKLSNEVAVDDAKIIIETRVPAELDDAAGQTEAQTLLKKNDLIAIYGSNEFAAKSIINAHDSIGGSILGEDGVIAVGFDSGTMQQNAIENGEFYGSVTQDPISIGYNAVELAVKAAQGEEVSDVDTGAVWYDSSNFESGEIAPLLYE